MTGFERNKESLEKVFSNNEMKKDKIERMPSAQLESIVKEFIRTHPKDMEMLK